MAPGGFSPTSGADRYAVGHLPTHQRARGARQLHRSGVRCRAGGRYLELRPGSVNRVGFRLDVTVRLHGASTVTMSWCKPGCSLSLILCVPPGPGLLHPFRGNTLAYFGHANTLWIPAGKIEGKLISAALYSTQVAATVVAPHQPKSLLRLLSSCHRDQQQGGNCHDCRVYSEEATVQGTPMVTESPRRGAGGRKDGFSWRPAKARVVRVVRGAPPQVRPGASSLPGAQGPGQGDVWRHLPAAVRSKRPNRLLVDCPHRCRRGGAASWQRAGPWRGVIDGGGARRVLTVNIQVC